jgi:hypothetical protein
MPVHFRISKIDNKYWLLPVGLEWAATWMNSDMFIHQYIPIIIIIILQCIGHSRPVPVQNFSFWTYESIWATCRTPWTGDQPDVRPLPIQDNTTQKNADTHPCLERDSNPLTQCSSDRRQSCLRPRGCWIWPVHIPFIQLWLASHPNHLLPQRPFRF